MIKKENRSIYKYYAITLLRFIVGTVFIPSGLLKIQGKRFSDICPEMYNSIFFQELHQTGIYWNFLGFCQLLTAFLLFSQRYTALAALMFCSICTNIFIFTISTSLTDKVIIMIFMMTSAVLLILWDWSKIKPLLVVNYIPETTKKRTTSVKIQIFGTILFGLIVAIFLLTDRYY